MDKLERLEKLLLYKVFDNYVTSHNYNGLSSYNINIECLEEDLVNAIINLINNNKIILTASKYDENPHIIRFGSVSKEKQIKYLIENKLSCEFCLYPSISYLSQKIEEEPLFPFRYKLKIGNPQFKPYFFKWDILYKYYSNPNYVFKFNDYYGKIESTNKVDERNYINLTTFGVGWDTDNNCVVVAFLKDLANMSSSCQVEWYNMLVDNQDECKTLGNYYDNLFNCCWNFPQTVYTSVLQEISNINQLTSFIWGKSFFREEFDKDDLEGFDMICIPTADVYHAYVALLEKVVVSNINDEYFKKIQLKTFFENGKLKGTLNCLKELIIHVNSKLEDEIVKPLKEVRKIRQFPAHKIGKNKYDIKYFKKQNELTISVFNALNLIRSLFQTHPDAKECIVKYNRTEIYLNLFER